VDGWLDIVRLLVSTSKARILRIVVGETLAADRDPVPPLRVYLAGGLALRSRDGVTVGGRDFAGRQGRRLFVRLAAIHGPVPHVDLADDLWDADWPPAWEVALRALASKLRATLGQVGVSGALSSTGGAYVLRLPAGTWVDIDAAADAIHRAEVALATGDLATASGWSLAARAISSRPLLPGEDGPWLEGLRRRLADIRLRSLEALAETWTAAGDAALGARDATEAIAVDPYRESAHRLLIRAHLAAGDRGAAARALEACRRSLEEDLGVSPSPTTLALLADGPGQRGAS
jgi:DNA-binding SARP family transcriptional activator